MSEAERIELEREREAERVRELLTEAAYQANRRVADAWSKGHEDHTKMEVSYRTNGELNIRCSCGARIVVPPPKAKRIETEGAAILPLRAVVNG